MQKINSLHTHLYGALHIDYSLRFTTDCNSRGNRGLPIVANSVLLQCGAVERYSADESGYPLSRLLYIHHTSSYERDKTFRTPEVSQT